MKDEVQQDSEPNQSAKYNRESLILAHKHILPIVFIVIVSTKSLKIKKKLTKGLIDMTIFHSLPNRIASG